MPISGRLTGALGEDKRVAHATKGFDGRTCLNVTMWMDHPQSLLV
jgi:hypothetical protein